MKWTLRRRKQRNAELQEEIQAHLLLAEREGIESGQTEKEARHSARGRREGLPAPGIQPRGLAFVPFFGM